MQRALNTLRVRLTLRFQ